MSEYNNSAVGSSSCAYSTLSTYNSSHAGLMGAPPYAAPVNTTGAYLVPAYAVAGYNALQHGDTQPSCSGFFNITNAYGKGANNCSTNYVQSLCNGGN